MLHTIVSIGLVVTLAFTGCGRTANNQVEEVSKKEEVNTAEIREEIKAEIREEIKAEIRAEKEVEIKEEMKKEIEDKETAEEENKGDLTNKNVIAFTDSQKKALTYLDATEEELEKAFGEPYNNSGREGGGSVHNLEGLDGVAFELFAGENGWGLWKVFYDSIGGLEFSTIEEMKATLGEPSWEGTYGEDNSYYEVGYDYYQYSLNYSGGWAVTKRNDYTGEKIDITVSETKQKIRE